ncbi:MAG: hypothetical protein SGARI_003422 [Bacillariaceae sp.]
MLIKSIRRKAKRVKMNYIEEVASLCETSRLESMIVAENGAKRQRLCKVASSETMTVADRAFEVFMRWYIDERIHQVIADAFQDYEFHIAAWFWERRVYTDEIQVYNEVILPHPNRLTCADTEGCWSEFGMKRMRALNGTIVHYNDLLIDKEPLIRRKAELGEDGFPYRPTRRDTIDLVNKLLEEF